MLTPPPQLDPQLGPVVICHQGDMPGTTEIVKDRFHAITVLRSQPTKKKNYRILRSQPRRDHPQEDNPLGDGLFLFSCFFINCQFFTADCKNRRGFRDLRLVWGSVIANLCMYVCIYIYMGVSKNRGTPKWMVFFMENPIKVDDLGVPLFFGNIQIYCKKKGNI